MKQRKINKAGPPLLPAQWDQLNLGSMPLAIVGNKMELGERLINQPILCSTILVKTGMLTGKCRAHGLLDKLFLALGFLLRTKPI